MKKFTALFTAFLMAFMMLVVSGQVFAIGDTSFTVEDDWDYFLELQVLDDDDKMLAQLSFYDDDYAKPDASISLADDLHIYGRYTLKFRIEAKEGVKVKIVEESRVDREAEATCNDLERAFASVDEMVAGDVSKVYKITEGNSTNQSNRFYVMFTFKGRTYYRRVFFTCLPKDYFVIWAYEDYETSSISTRVLSNSTEIDELLGFESSLADNLQFGMVPFYDVREVYSIKINGHVNTGREALSEGENYFTIEFRGKKYDAVVTRPETVKWTNPFLDVDKKDPFFNSVKYCNMNGLMQGTSKTTFDPDAITTRAMVVTTLYRIAGSPKVDGTNEFSDVEPGSWYYDAVTWASENGIVLGYDDGKFGTNDNITREQFATIMYRYAEWNCNVRDVTYFNYPYSEDDVADYARVPMRFAIMSGIIKTSDVTNLEPKKSVSRGELAMGLAGLKTYTLPTLEFWGYLVK